MVTFTSEKLGCTAWSVGKHNLGGKITIVTQAAEMTLMYLELRTLGVFLGMLATVVLVIVGIILVAFIMKDIGII